MPKKRSLPVSKQFSINLPPQAVGMLEQLIGVGLYGTSRAEVARTLILSRLEQLIAQSIVNATQ